MGCGTSRSRVDCRCVGQAGDGCRPLQFLVQSCSDPVCVEPGSHEKNPLAVHAIEARILEPSVGVRTPKSFREGRQERASDVIVGGLGPHDRPVSRTIIIAGQLKLYPTDKLLVEWCGRGVESDGGGIEVSPRIRDKPPIPGVPTRHVPSGGTCECFCRRSQNAPRAAAS